MFHLLEIPAIIVLAFGLFIRVYEFVEKGSCVQLNVHQLFKSVQDGLDVVVVGEASLERLNFHVLALFLTR